MGFLDHSTNNIIVDAVLTTKGRELLANNDDSFSINFFALGDDEVDYNIIKQYGRTVGKEKIEKNTPVQEAVTNGEQAIKSKLFSLAPSSLGGSLFFPFGEFSGANLTGDSLLKLTTVNNIPKAFNFNIKMKDNASIPSGLRQGNFEIILDGNLLQISNTTAEFTYSDNTAAYDVPGTSALTDTTIYGLEPSLTIRDSLLNSTTFSVYKTKNQSYVRTFVTIRHKFSGISKQLEVQIYDTSI